MFLYPPTLSFIHNFYLTFTENLNFSAELRISGQHKEIKEK